MFQNSADLSTLVWAPRQTRLVVESWAQLEGVTVNMWDRNSRNLSHTPAPRSSEGRPSPAAASSARSGCCCFRLYLYFSTSG